MKPINERFEELCMEYLSQFNTSPTDDELNGMIKYELDIINKEYFNDELNIENINRNMTFNELENLRQLMNLKHKIERINGL